MSKGLSLAIEMIVAIALAVIIMLVLGAFFIGSWSPANQMSDASAWSTMCGQAMQRGCKLEDFSNEKITLRNYDTNGDSQPDGIVTACKKVFGYTRASECREKCCGSSSSNSRTGSRQGRTGRSLR